MVSKNNGGYKSLYRNLKDLYNDGEIPSIKDLNEKINKFHNESDNNKEDVGIPIIPEDGKEDKLKKYFGDEYNKNKEYKEYEDKQNCLNIIKFTILKNGLLKDSKEANDFKKNNDFKTLGKKLCNETDKSNVKSLVSSYRELGESYVIRLASTSNTISSTLGNALSSVANGAKNAIKSESILKQNYEFLLEKEKELDKRNLSELMREAFGDTDTKFKIGDISSIEDKMKVDAGSCVLRLHKGNNEDTTEDIDPWGVSDFKEAKEAAENLNKKDPKHFKQYFDAFKQAYDNAAKKTRDKLAKGETLEDPITGVKVKDTAGVFATGAKKAVGSMFKAIDNMPTDLFTLQIKIAGLALKGILAGAGAVAGGVKAYKAWQSNKKALEKNYDTEEIEAEDVKFDASTKIEPKTNVEKFFKNILKKVGVSESMIMKKRNKLITEDDVDDVEDDSVEGEDSGSDEKIEQAINVLASELYNDVHTDFYLLQNYLSDLTFNKKKIQQPAPLFTLGYSEKKENTENTNSEDNKNESVSLHDILMRICEEEEPGSEDEASTEVTNKNNGNKDRQNAISYADDIKGNNFLMNYYKKFNGKDENKIVKIGSFKQLSNLGRIAIVFGHIIERYQNIPLTLAKVAKEYDVDVNNDDIVINGGDGNVVKIPDLKSLFDKHMKSEPTTRAHMLINIILTINFKKLIKAESIKDLNAILKKYKCSKPRDFIAFAKGCSTGNISEFTADESFWSMVDKKAKIIENMFKIVEKKE